MTAAILTEKAAAPRAHHEDIAWLIRDVNQHPAGPPVLDMRLDHGIAYRLAPHRRERVPYPLARQFTPHLHQAGRRLCLYQSVTTRWLPYQDWHQHGAMRAGEEYRITQCARLPGEPLVPTTTRRTPAMAHGLR